MVDNQNTCSVFSKPRSQFCGRGNIEVTRPEIHSAVSSSYPSAEITLGITVQEFDVSRGKYLRFTMMNLLCVRFPRIPTS
jgi:hypothetical protein